ncbi:MAG: GNAT family N-acetyltransferase [Elstera sp.]
MSVLQLVPAVDADFGWLLDPRTEHPRGLRVPPGGVEAAPVLSRLRQVANKVRLRHSPGMWLMVVEREIVGLIGYKLAPDAEGRVEIGYGVAASRQQRGHCTQAVAQVVRIAEQDGKIHLLYAETTVANQPSQKLLRANGFQQTATREDVEDGALFCWSRAV